MSEEIKEILDKLNKTADNPLFVICSSQKELDKIPKYTANFLSVNDRQAKLLLNYITNLQQKVEEKNKEIDRLNNIINEIQDMCREEYYKKNTTDIDSIGLSNNIWVMIYMKIKENNNV